MDKKVQPRHVSHQLNLRALLIVVVVVVVAVPVAIGLKMAREQSHARGVLAEAKAQSEAGKPALAIGYLNRYLELRPENLDALELKAKILFDTTRDGYQAQEALRVHGRLIAGSPDDPRWEPARRRMVRLNLMIGQWASALEMAGKLKVDDAEAHRLRARAWMRVGLATKNDRAIARSLAEFEAAEAREPGDVESAEEMATIYRERQEKPEKALEVLDQVVRNTAASPRKHAEALLARARHHAAVRDDRAAIADVDAAVRDDPEGLMPRLTAAEVALQRHDIDAARHHLASIPKEHRDDPRVKNLEGLVEMADARPDAAIRAWRHGLMRVGGNDASLTWQLAHALLEMGRVSDAEPLLDQYRRLVGGDEPDPRYLFLTALGMLRSNRPAEAIRRLEAIRFKVPKTLEPNVLLSLGQAYEATRDRAKAADAYRQAAEGARSWSPPWKALAQLEAATDPEAAQATLQKGLTLLPNDSELLVARARLLYREQLKRPAPERSLGELERLLAQAAKSSPGSAEVALLRAEILANDRRGEDALALLKSASALAPDSIPLWLARADLLVGLGRLGDAQALLEEAAQAAGAQAVFAITRAAILIRQGQLSRAAAVLREAAGRVPSEQQTLIWKNLGDLHRGRGEFAESNRAYGRWAALQPQNPEPRLALVMNAMLANDEPAVARGIEELRTISGERSYFWRLAEIDALLRNRDRPAGPEQLDRAARLIREIQENDPQIALGYMLEGRIAQRRGRPEEAIAAYRKAMAQGAGPVALAPLVALLSREKRDGEIEQLRKDYPDLATGIERLATAEAIRSGDRQRARALADQVMKGDPNALDARRWQVEVLEKLGDAAAAEAALRRWIAESPGELTPRFALLMLQGKAGDRAGQEATAQEIQKHVKAERPELLMALVYRQLGEWKRARGLYREAIDRAPDDPTVLGAAVEFDQQMGLRDEAERLLRKMLARQPSDSWASRKLALSLARHAADRAAWEEALALIGPEAKGNDVVDDQVLRAAIYALGPEPAHRRKAIAILEALLAELPRRVDLHEQAARLYLATGDLEKAREHAARGAEPDGAGAESLLFYAGLLVRLGDLSGAEAQLDRLVKIDPDSLPVAELKARILAARGKGAEGAAILEKAFDGRAAAPDALAIGEDVVAILEGLKQPEAAERVARKLAERAPKGRCVLARVLADAGRFDDAAEQLDWVAGGGEPTLAAATALSLAAEPDADRRWTDLADRYGVEAEKGKAEPPTFAALQRLARLQHLKRDYRAEVDTYRKMIAADPPNLLFLNNMAWILSEELNNPEEALEVIDRAIDKVGKQPNLLDTRGVILDRLGRYEQAAGDLERAAEATRDPIVFYHLARVYLKQDRPEDFKKARDRAAREGLVRSRLQPSELGDWDKIMKP